MIKSFINVPDEYFRKNWYWAIILFYMGFIVRRLVDNTPITLNDSVWVVILATVIALTAKLIFLLLNKLNKWVD